MGYAAVNIDCHCFGGTWHRDHRGISFKDRKETVFQVAIMEAKRAFRGIKDRRPPTTSDEPVDRTITEGLVLRVLN